VEAAEAVTLVTYRRTGGGAPAFDEELEVDDDGSFRMVRRVSADRAGTFAGTLDSAAQQELSAALAELGAPLVSTPMRPRVVLELIDWAGGSASFPLEDDLPAEWQRVRDALQNLVEELKQFPVAALEIRLDDAGETAIMSVVGEHEITVSFRNSALALTLFDEDEEYVDSATAALPADLADAAPLPPGWQHEVRLDHGLPFNPKRILQLSVDLDIDGRPSQLSCTGGKGWF
jgi:hypothetical protein